MKVALFLILSLLPLLGNPPRKRSMNELSSLWINSPFTTKPAAALAQNSLNEWSLAGISGNPKTGYTVTLLNKKDRNDRKRIHTSGLNNEKGTSGFKVLEVSQASGSNYKTSKVKVSIGSDIGWVEYDQAVLSAPKVKAPPALSNRRTTTARPTTTNTRTSSSSSQLPGRTPSTPSTNGSNNSSTSTPSTPSIRRPVIRRVTPSSN